MASLTGIIDIISINFASTNNAILQNTDIETINSHFYSDLDLYSIPITSTSGTQRLRIPGGIGYGGMPVVGSIFGSTIVAPNNRVQG